MNASEKAIEYQSMKLEKMKNNVTKLNLVTKQLDTLASDLHTASNGLKTQIALKTANIATCTQDNTASIEKTNSYYIDIQELRNKLDILNTSTAQAIIKQRQIKKQQIAQTELTKQLEERTSKHETQQVRLNAMTL
jgi:predicted RNase H-like nuclease (RuvC/YqgF family)